MTHLSPIKRLLFEKYLKSKGCIYKRTSGDHVIYSRGDLKRPVVFPADSEVQIMVIRTNLKTLGETLEQFYKDIEKL